MHARDSTYLCDSALPFVRIVFDTWECIGGLARGLDPLHALRLLRPASEVHVLRGDIHVQRASRCIVVFDVAHGLVAEDARGVRTVQAHGRADRRALVLGQVGGLNQSRLAARACVVVEKIIVAGLVIPVCSEVVSVQGALKRRASNSTRATCQILCTSQ
jgi:hypothetical protein